MRKTAAVHPPTDAEKQKATATKTVTVSPVSSVEHKTALSSQPSVPMMTAVMYQGNFTKLAATGTTAAAHPPTNVGKGKATAITTLTVNLVLSANLMAVMAAASTGTTTAAFAKTILSGEKSKHYSNGK